MATVGRVTQHSIATSALRGLTSSLTRVQDLQDQLSSGRRISQASDDPSATRSAMTLRSRRAADEQYLRNADFVSSRLNVTDSTVVQVADRLREVRQHVLESRSSALSSDGRAALASQVTAIRGEMLQLYNTTYLDRPIFGGTVAGNTAVQSDSTYVGDDAEIAVRISTDTVVRVDVAGTGVGADTVPDLLDRIATDIQTPGGAGEQDLTDLDAVISNVLVTLGDIGARQSRVDTVKANVTSDQLDLTQRISESEDVDLPEVIMNLQAQQVGYQAALGAAAKIMQTSLADFLR